MLTNWLKSTRIFRARKVRRIGQPLCYGKSFKMLAHISCSAVEILYSAGSGMKSIRVDLSELSMRELVQSGCSVRMVVYAFLVSVCLWLRCRLQWCCLELCITVSVEWFHILAVSCFVLWSIVCDEWSMVFSSVLANLEKSEMGLYEVV